MEKLLISIIIDNSLAMSEENLSAFKKEFSKFIKAIKSFDTDQQIEIELICYNDFAPLVAKNFTEEFELRNVERGRIPFFDRAMCEALESLNERMEEIVETGCGLYKGWLIPIVDSRCFDKEFKSSSMLITMLKEGKISYFPFKLKKQLSPEFNEVEKIRTFNQIINYSFSGFFWWLLNMAQERVSKPSCDTILMKREAFKGWTNL